jgi:ubiquinone/menaquinone biosynthesis C-methylase UbiE
MVLNTVPDRQSTTRFSDRVADYVMYRPRYPVEIIDLLAAGCSLTPESVVADIGSGTGIMAKLFLENGNAVIGVEPNAEMRRAGERYLVDYARFTSMDGTAEATRLPAQAMDFVIAAQAFHWFDRDKTRAEFRRIVKPEGFVVLVWNDRRIDSTPFLRDYESLLREFAVDYADVNHKNVQDRTVFESFFGGTFATATLGNVQRFDLEGMLGRLKSSSYTPAAESVRHGPMMARAREIFLAHQQAGHVTFEYDTRVYYANMQ